MPARSIYLTSQDLRQLCRLLESSLHALPDDREHLESLYAELDRAMVVSDEELPVDVVTMRSRVRIRDLESGRRDEYTLVYPREADVASNRLSVLAPLGTALLGYREDDEFEWLMPGGVRRLRVEKILYQPEAAMRARESVQAFEEYRN